ncbi:MAG: ferrous iron transporter B [Treponema sp.]|jgi:ferrous iron transport protein B|nr:ferrous iron transporter B [Treponema sp.]
MGITIALAGNPNSGKTTLFNMLTGSNQFVGNWPGVTVEKKEGRLKNHRDVTVTDLPGIYSLSPYSLEEVIARNYLTEQKPGLILNIVDGTNLERNLFLTTQLLEMGIPVLVLVNMIDAVSKSGDSIDLVKLEKSLACPVAAISALKGTGVAEAVERALSLAEEAKPPKPVVTLPSAGPADLHDGEDLEALDTEARYEFISGVVAGCHKRNRIRGDLSVSDRIDRVLTNRFLALPIFAAIIFIVYFVSVTTVGTWVTDWTNDGLFGEGWHLTGGGAFAGATAAFEAGQTAEKPDPENFGIWIPGVPVLVENALEALGTAQWLNSLILDGIIGGMGAVLGFVPQMLVLFLFLAVLEACGYMARIAFILDRVFRRFGLSGKSFIPMLIGTGCGIPGVMASRTIENEYDRRLTVMVTTFMPCGAKLPVIALISGAVLGGAWWVAPSAYFLGILSVIVSGIILKKSPPFRGDVSPFVMELPAYHVPGPVNVLRSMWERAWSFIKKAGSVILISAVLIWFLSGFGFTGGGFGMVQDLNQGLLALIGSAIAPVFAPLGFGTWDAAVATITGMVAKENVVGTMGVLYGFGEVGEEGREMWETFAANFSALSAYAFLVFNLYCPPCFAAIGAIRREMNNGRWTFFAVSYQLLFGYTLSLIVYQLGSFMAGGAFNAGTAAGLAVLALYIALLVRRPGGQNRGAGGT